MPSSRALEILQELIDSDLMPEEMLEEAQAVLDADEASVAEKSLNTLHWVADSMDLIRFASNLTPDQRNLVDTVHVTALEASAGLACDQRWEDERGSK